MVRTIFLIVITVAALVNGATQTPTHGEASPFVSILLPPTIPSEKVQVSYLLAGPFGGRGGYVSPRANVHSYEIPAIEEGKAATEIRMIVYAPSCEIQTFVIPLAEDSRIKQEFRCQPVATAHLSGEILPTELARDDDVEIVITYMAYWAHGFYGITDGFVTQFRLETVRPDSNGMFEVDVPYFSIDASSPSEPRASFGLGLRHSKSGNPIPTKLEPDIPELMLKNGGLRIRSTYPYVLKLTGGHA